MFKEDTSCEAGDFDNNHFLFKPKPEDSLYDWVLWNDRMPLIGYSKDDGMERLLPLSDDNFIALCDTIHSEIPQFDMALYEQSATKHPLDIPIEGLQTALERFSGNGVRGECGPWNIASDFHISDDLSTWNLFYEDKLVASRVACGDSQYDIWLSIRLSPTVSGSLSTILAKEYPDCHVVNAPQPSFER